MKSLIVFVVALVLAWVAYGFVTFSVDETQKAVVVQLGKIEKIVEKPGLYFKTPFVQNIVYLEDRLLSQDIKSAEVLTVDKQRLTVDSYTLWRIRDPRLFVESTNGGVRETAEKALDDNVYSLLRDVLGQKSFQDVLSREFLSQVKTLAQEKMADWGVEIVDVRIKRADLPESNKNSVYSRMIREREQIAQKFRAEGEQEAQRIRAETDRKVQIIVAEANKRNEELKGEGDAQALQIYAESYNKNEDFFLFWRTLESYKLTLAQNSTLVLSTDSDYLRLLDTMKTGVSGGQNN